jgi:prepilin-type N-terminal cleavage/methylation domain-containing protein
MKKGFTLIEFLIYISIFASILVLLFGFFWDIIFSNIKGNVIQEIQENGNFSIFKISREIKRAKSINFPPQGSSGNYLSLEMTDSNLNPTVFDFFDGKLRVTQGSNPSYFLTSDSVRVTNLSFSNLSFSQTPGIIEVEIEISSSNSLYQTSMIFKSSFSLFPNQ